MELTPETFENAEFVERRRGGYDIDQVEAFLEETGTEFARMLVRFEQANKRLAQSDERTSSLEREIAELRQKVEASEARAAHAEQAARHARAESEQARSRAENLENSEPAASQEEVTNVARALVIAQEAADEALREAKNEAQALIDAATTRSERQLSDTAAKIEVLVNEAKARADREYVRRREAALAEINELEARRSELTGIVERLDDRIGGYREDLRRAAAELVSIAEDPSLMGGRDGATGVEAQDERPSSQESSTASPQEGTDVSVTDDSPEKEPTDSAISDGDSTDEVSGQDPDDEAPDELATGSGSAPRSEASSGEREAAAVSEVSELDSEADLSADDGADPLETPTGALQEELDLDTVLSEGEEASDVHADAIDARLADDPAESATEYLDIRSTPSARTESPERDSRTDDSRDSAEWGPGSWSKIAESLPDTEGDDTDRGLKASGPVVATTASTALHDTVRAQDPGTDAIEDEYRDDRPTEAVERAEFVRDRYLEELDQAVNTDIDPEDEALAAFLEGNSDTRARRFGWRR